MKNFQILILVLLFAAEVKGQIEIDSSYLDLFEYHQYSDKTLGVTALYFSKHGLIMNQGQNGVLSKLLPNKSNISVINFDYKFGETEFHFPGQAITRYFETEEDDPLILVVKESDLALPGNELFYPEFQIIKFENTNIDVSTLAIEEVLNNPYGDDIGFISPYDGVINNSGELYFYTYIDPVSGFTPNHFCKYTFQNDETECSEVQIGAIKFYQNHLKEIYFTDSGLNKLYKLNDDLTYTFIMDLTDFVDLQIYNSNEIIIGTKSGFEIFNYDFSQKLDSIGFLLDSKEFVTKSKEIILIDKGSVIKIDENKQEHLLYENQCQNHSYSRIALNNNHVYIFGGKKNALQLKSISLNPDIENQNNYNSIDLKTVGIPKVFSEIISPSSNPIWAYKLNFTIDIEIKNTGSEIIDSIQLNMNTDYPYFNKNKLPVTFKNLNIFPNDTKIVEFKTSLESIADNEIMVFPADLPSVISIEVFKTNQYFPCSIEQIIIDNSEFAIISNTKDITKEDTGQIFEYFPNPTADIIYLKTTSASKYRVFDVFGILVREGICNSEINVSALKAGYYNIEILNKNGRSLQFMKVVKI